jgi:hypothetical protein
LGIFGFLLSCAVAQEPFCLTDGLREHDLTANVAVLRDASHSLSFEQVCATTNA